MLHQMRSPTQASTSHAFDFFQTIATTLLILLSVAVPSTAHPLKVPPLDHPHVASFDQFYLPEDDDAFLTQGGLILLAELNCSACHAPPTDWSSLIGPKAGPNLSGVGSRLDIDALWRLIRSPQHRKPGTQMPGLFAGNVESDPDTIEAIATYLASLTSSLPTTTPGDPAHGKILYHTLGCVACHEPGTDYRPTSLPAEADLESPSLASSPIALADDYTYTALTAFLLDPLATRPASRMPAQHLSPAEAADIAAYLHTGRLPAAFRERQILNLPPQPASLGQKLFSQHRCHSCHDNTGEKHAAPRPPAVLTQLNPDSNTGCLSKQTLTGIPDYDLSDLQIRALRLALKAVQSHAKPALSPPEQLTHHLSRLNCFACHDHDGRGGPEIARAPYFTTSLRLLPNDDLQNLPPTLHPLPPTHTPESLLKRLTAPEPAPGMGTRMPRFAPPAIAPIPSLLLAP
jgi:mono/diheme cytochrome c family protein